VNFRVQEVSPRRFMVSGLDGWQPSIWQTDSLAGEFVQILYLFTLLIVTPTQVWSRLGNLNWLRQRCVLYCLQRRHDVAGEELHVLAGEVGWQRAELEEPEEVADAKLLSVFQ
jgi:hypothetical protein